MIRRIWKQDLKVNGLPLPRSTNNASKLFTKMAPSSSSEKTAPTLPWPSYANLGLFRHFGAVFVDQLTFFVAAYQIRKYFPPIYTFALPEISGRIIILALFVIQVITIIVILGRSITFESKSSGVNELLLANNTLQTFPASART